MLVGTARADVTDPAFVEDTLYRGNGMIAIEHGPGGRLYVTEKRGRVLVFQPSGSGFAAPTVAYDIVSSVFSSGEAGLLGMKLDPDFANNRYAYLFYTTQSDQRLVRVTADSTYNTFTPSSALVLLSGLPRRTDYHKAGDIQFHPTDSSAIYVSVGDDGQRTLAQNVDYYEGKILRVNKSDGRGFSNNPFASSDLGSVRSRVWAIGFRNPFRFTFHPNAPHADVMYVSENGDDTDRVSRVLRGSNGSWSSAGDGPFLSPADPNHRVLFTQQPFNTGIAIARGGSFASPADSDVLLVGNGTRGVWRYRLSGNNLDQVTAIGSSAFISNLSFAGAVDMSFGPDGALYFTQTGGGASTGTTYTLKRVRSSGMGGAQRPVARFTTNPSPPSGVAPLTVRFTDTSTDADGSVTSWAWSFGDGTTSSSRNPSKTYSGTGTYTASLTVTDDDGLTSATPATVTVSTQNTRTVQLYGRVRDARTWQNAMLAVPTELRLYDGSLTRPLVFAGGVGPNGNGVTVPASSVINRTLSLPMTTQNLIVSACEPSADGMQTAYKGFVLPASGSTTVVVEYNVSSAAIGGRVLDTRDAPAVVDLGIARNSATSWYGVPGGRDRSNNPTGVRHRIQSDALGFYYFPIRSADAGSTFYIDLLADTNTSIYTGADFSVVVAQNALVARDLVVGRYNGGLACDNLASIPTTPNVNYETHIRPIFDAQCTGCHSPTAADSGGLDLMTDGEAALVGAMSGHVPGMLRVLPGNLAGSFLMEKVNCQDPQRGDRMRPTDAMPAAQQALIRDWILSLD